MDTTINKFDTLSTNDVIAQLQTSLRTAIQHATPHLPDLKEAEIAQIMQEVTQAQSLDGLHAVVHAAVARVCLTRASHVTDDAILGLHLSGYAHQVARDARPWSSQTPPHHPHHPPHGTHI